MIIEENLYQNIFLYLKSNRNPRSTLIKLLAFTNRRIEAFNKVIRDSLFNDKEEYHIGEILVGYDNSEYGKANFLKILLLTLLNTLLNRLLNVIAMLD